MDSVKVTVVTVVYGKRWPLLRQVADACISDKRYSKFIIVDNGCINAKEMDEYALQYPDRIVIIRQDGNIGYSGAISRGLFKARDTDSDYVLILDDDSVPEEGAIDYYLNNLKLFNDDKVILTGNRIDVPGNKDYFVNRPLQDRPSRGTLFEVFSVRKLINITRLLLNKKPKNNFPFIPIIPTTAFVTGGTLLPMKLVREVDVPDAGMFIYGEDLEYSWRTKKLGYQSYVCARPIIRDIDMTFPNYGDHIFGLFDPATPAYKVYYRMRNAVLISVKHTEQYKIILIINVIVWYISLCFIGLIKWGLTKNYLKRARLVAIALYTGFKPNTKVPAEVVTPE
jgi:GT2 family glycosyltransferase